MALRFLLLRIATPSAPRMVPVHGVSPAAAVRSVGSQGEARAVVEQESMKVSNKDFAQLEEAARQGLAELSRAVDDLRKVNNASVFVVAAIPWIMIYGSKIVGSN